MSVKQIVEELKVVRDSFNNEYDACPVCIIEAIRVLETLVGRKEQKRKKEEPITLTDEQITEMWESGYISDKEKYKDGND